MKQTNTHSVRKEKCRHYTVLLANEHIFLNPTFIVSFHAQGLRIVPHDLPHEVPLLYFQALATQFPPVAQYTLFKLLV